jgi:hypothetical protein
VLSIPERAEALRGVRLYVGDGASIVRPIVRRRGRRRFGHGPIRDQLAWCRAEGVRSAVFTHCGSQIVAGNERRSEARVAELARAVGVEASVAYDGMTRVLAIRRGRRAVTG